MLNGCLKSYFVQKHANEKNRKISLKHENITIELEFGELIIFIHNKITSCFYLFAPSHSTPIFTKSLSWGKIGIMNPKYEKTNAVNCEQIENAIFM